MTSLEQEIDLSISIAKTTGIVLARSAFHHSLNYKSVVLFGKDRLVAEQGKEKALKSFPTILFLGVGRKFNHLQQKKEKQQKSLL